MHEKEMIETYIYAYTYYLDEMLSLFIGIQRRFAYSDLKKNRKLGHIKNKMFVYVLEVIILMTFTLEKTAFLFINQVDLRGGGVTLTPPRKSSKHQSIV